MFNYDKHIPMYDIIVDETKSSYAEFFQVKDVANKLSKMLKKIAKIEDRKNKSKMVKEMLGNADANVLVMFLTRKLLEQSSSYFNS